MGRKDGVFIIAVRFFLVLYSWKTMGGGGGGDLCDDFFFSSVELKKVTKKAASRSGGRTERRSRENCGRRPFQIRLNASPSPLSRSPHQTSLSLPRSARRRRGSKRTSFFISSALPVFTNERGREGEGRWNFPSARGSARARPPVRCSPFVRPSTLLRSSPHHSL